MFRILATHRSVGPRLRARGGATRAMAVALLVVVALAGMGLGFAADRLALHNERGPSRRAGPGPGFGLPDGGGRRGLGHRGEGMRERFARELDLTPEQARRVDLIMAQQMSDFRRLRESMQPRFDSLLATAQSRLDSVLTPAQRGKLGTLRAREAFGPRDSFGGRDWRPPPFP
jgi:Spy/CpxP family protein refolding chaperone